jgi:hypothetical protein
MSYLGSPPASQFFAPGTDTFSGTGSQTAFTLSRNVATVNDIQVVVNNVVQQPSNYSVLVNILTFSPAPSAGTDNIYVRYLSTNITAVVPQQGTVTNSSFAPGASEFASGTRLTFAQATAPTGWTQDVSDNADNRMLRVVNTSGGGIGGSSSPILNNVVPAHTHGFTSGTNSVDHSHSGSTSTESNDHQHQYFVSAFGPNTGAPYTSSYSQDKAQGVFLTSGITANHTHAFTSGGQSTTHTHSGTTDNGSSSTNWTPRYIDLILCAKA